ncbi:Inherit from KOG: AlkB, alkylation repair homolog 1 (E. coli) [Seminavis robusta]|uniref:Inherit from KOG: AlkB, alkylation repair homolog 1 (E. coli) n=1 Tax=Seminavis robusta TaxID=568900 RepID=A0A9N8DH31_9STRA|nr:Inherit from KOG: AlkB, alkylation repair homolog 1 (E. coli) [Seminavis robusta]|eukprot:Sro155_g070560.1 Inherit from KOG: AlkB, alkylation repair homolog 1 (E. coli) (296) ;mRNA; r:97304-98191
MDDTEKTTSAMDYSSPVEERPEGVSKKAWKRLKKANMREIAKKTKVEVAAREGESSTMNTTETREETREPAVEMLRPGLVVVRRISSRASEEAIVAKFLEIGNHPTDGFYETDADGNRKLNSTLTRGRIYRELAFYGDEATDWILEHCAKAVRLARAADPAMPAMVPDHALLLYYSTNRGIKEHRDVGANDGEGDAPIVSFNFGKSVVYRVRMSKEEEKTDVHLDPGDVILFGGPARMIYHSVKICRDSSSPYPKLLPDRMNLTLRYAPSILGREEEFRTFKPADIYWKNRKEVK